MSLIPLAQLFKKKKKTKTKLKIKCRCKSTFFFFYQILLYSKAFVRFLVQMDVVVKYLIYSKHYYFGNTNENPSIDFFFKATCSIIGIVLINCIYSHLISELLIFPLYFCIPLLCQRNIRNIGNGRIIFPIMILLISPPRSNELLTFNSVTSLSFVLTTHSNIVFHTKENEGIQLIGLHEFRISIFLIYGFLRIRQTFCRKIYNNGLDRLYREISLTFLISEV